MRTICHFINGQSVTRTDAVTSPVYDPSTGQVQAILEHGDMAILAEAVRSPRLRTLPGPRSTPSGGPG